MKTFLFFLIIASLFGCRSFDSGISKDPITIKAEPSSMESGKLFTKVKPVQLQGSDLPLAVYRVLPHSNGVYIIDGKKQSVLDTDSNGNIINVIKAVGDGPGEYKEIWDMKINPENKALYLLDRKSAKMLVYSSSLEFIEEVPIKKEFVVTLLSFGFINRDEVLFHTSGTSGYKFLKYGITSKKFEFKVPIDKEFKGLGFGNDRSMSLLNNRISLIYPLSNKIERYDQNLQRGEDLFVDFQIFMISESELELIANDQNRMFDLIQNDENRKAHSFLLEETSKYYVLSFYLGSFRNGDFLKSIIEKSTGETKTFKTLKIADLELDILLIGKGKEDELIFTVNSEQLERMTSSQIEALSKKLKIPVDPDKPLLLFCMPR